MNNIVKNYIMLYTNNNDLEYYLDAFKEYCEYNNYEIKGEGTDMEGLYLGGKITFWDYYNNSVQEDIETFWDNLKWLKNSKYNSKCVITGNLGLWNGNHDIKPVLCTSLYDAIKKCATDADDLYISVNDNIIDIKAYHHDGTNSFEIRLLNDDDYDCVMYWEDEKDGDVIDYIKANAMDIYYENIGLC